jgi:hypothetical protein
VWLWVLMLFMAHGHAFAAGDEVSTDDVDLAAAHVPASSATSTVTAHAPDPTADRPTAESPRDDIPKADPASDKPKDLAIFPGFEREELARSVDVTLRAMERCLTRGYVQKQPVDRATAVPYVGASVIDGQPVAMLQREIRVRCDAKPLRRCTAIHVWDPHHDEISYSSVQCYGAYDAPYAYYLVTAVLDLKKAHKPGKRGTNKDKAIVTSSVSFQTTEFPGTHVVAYSETRRLDASETALPTVARFDDYQPIYSDVDSSPLTSEQIHALARSTSHMACLTTRACP